MTRPTSPFCVAMDQEQTFSDAVPLHSLSRPAVPVLVAVPVMSSSLRDRNRFRIGRRVGSFISDHQIDRRHVVYQRRLMTDHVKKFLA